MELTHQNDIVLIESAPKFIYFLSKHFKFRNDLEAPLNLASDFTYCGGP